MDDVPVSAVRAIRDVLAYFVRHPSAADSLEGIARWRVQQQSVPQIVERVDHALTWLVEAQLLVREDRIGGAPTFRLPPSRAGDAKRLLQDIDGDG